MLDIDGSGSVSVNEFRKFVEKYGAKQVRDSAGSSSAS
jgi:hypothetical protein